VLHQTQQEYYLLFISKIIKYRRFSVRYFTNK